MNNDFDAILTGMKSGLEMMRTSSVSKSEFENRLNRYKTFDYKNLSNDDVYWMITYVMLFNMGRKASMIEKQLPMFKKYLFGLENITTLSDIEIAKIIARIGFRPQVERIVANAKTFARQMEEYGTFDNYLKRKFDIHDTHADPKKLELLHAEFGKLKGYGETAPWHLITELGFFSLKPDTVIRRIFFRLGLIQSPSDMQATIDVGRRMSLALDVPIRYIDIVAVKFGQVGPSNLLGTADGICTENDPKCNICTLGKLCKRKHAC
jgi:DNA-3-methyladenine glycosylase I